MRFVLPVLLGLACGPSVRFERDDGAVVRVLHDVEVASTAEARRVGLSGRTALGVEQALVLEFPVVGEACITNVSVSFPIVAHFVASDGRLVASEALGAGEGRAPCHLEVQRVVETDVAGAPGATRVR